MIREICDFDAYTNNNKFNGSELQQKDLTNLFRAATDNTNHTSLLNPLMAGCTRDVTFEGYYKDKDGNVYGGSITISGGKDSEESQGLISDCIDGPDPRDQEYE